MCAKVKKFEWVIDEENDDHEDEVCWSYVGIILDPFIFGIENDLQSCEENSEIWLRTPFFGFKISDMLY